MTSLIFARTRSSSEPGLSKHHFNASACSCSRTLPLAYTNGYSDRFYHSFGLCHHGLILYRSPAKTLLNQLEHCWRLSCGSSVIPILLDPSFKTF